VLHCKRRLMWNISKNMTYTPYFFRRNRVGNLEKLGQFGRTPHSWQDSLGSERGVWNVRPEKACESPSHRPLDRQPAGREFPPGPERTTEEKTARTPMKTQ